jgi:hypothetical protein
MTIRDKREADVVAHVRDWHLGQCPWPAQENRCDYCDDVRLMSLESYLLECPMAQKALATFRQENP